MNNKSKKLLTIILLMPIFAVVLWYMDAAFTEELSDIDVIIPMIVMALGSLISLRAMRGLDCRDESLDGAPMKSAEISELSHVEHNRWNAEKVLMGYRKARPEEDKHVHKQFAAELQKNKAHYIHHDLRPYAELDMILKLDEEFTSHMPWIIQMTK